MATLKLKEKAVVFEGYMRNFYSEYWPSKGAEYVPSRDGVSPNSWYSAMSINDVLVVIDHFVKENLNNDWVMFDEMMFDWMEIYKERNRENLNEDALDREDTVHLNNFWLNLGFAKRIREEKSGYHGSCLLSSRSCDCFYKVRRLCFKQDLEEIVQKLKFDLEDPVVIVKKYGYGDRSFSKFPSELMQKTVRLYKELRKLGYQRADLVG